MRLKAYHIALFALFPMWGFCEQITIIGSNYVGLTTAAVLIQCGHEVTCVDIDKDKIAQLNHGKMPIFEPGLDQHLFEMPSKCTFTHDIKEALRSPIIYICVGTNLNESGVCDCKDVYSALSEIAKLSTDTKIICIKSTIPPGTTKKIKSRFADSPHVMHFIYNPEFMRQGSAIDDIMSKNPLVLGGESDHLVERIESLYLTLIENGTTVIKTNFETAELIKYSWNSFSAIRIAYTNELSLLCNEFGGDIFKLVQGIALSERLLPTAELRPGPGIGGSCLPKDTKAFASLIEERGLAPSMIHQAIKSNAQHIQHLIDQIFRFFEYNVGGKKIAILGLAFKANTDDIRNAPSVAIISSLINHGALVRAYDPYAAQSMQKIFPQIEYFNSTDDAIEDADCILVLTDWDTVKNLDLEKASTLCNRRVIFDPRNLFDPAILREYGFTSFNLGRLR